MTLRFLPPDPVAEPTGTRAAVYLRMSTDLQVHSLENQLRVIEAYAVQQQMRIVQTYADPGRSGLTLQRRPALTALLEDVQRGPDFEVVLVYDVSRWGRFQDVDESAYYEYQCRKAGVPIIYCAEQFENDASPMAAVYKSIKRVMAAEYSRELSRKVFAGQCRIVELGFRGGGSPTYGLRRVLVDAAGRRRTTLVRGEQKSLQTDRIILAPGAPAEVAIVRRIFHLYVDEKWSKCQIARQLNAEGLTTPSGRKWELSLIRRILENEAYIGNNVFNRTTSKMARGRRYNPRERWIRADDAFEPIIDKRTFQRAQLRSRARSGDMTKDEMLVLIKALLKKRGHLSASIIDAEEALPSSSTYKKFFGALTTLYEELGYRPRYNLTNVIAFNARHHAEKRAAKLLATSKTANAFGQQSALRGDP